MPIYDYHCDHCGHVFSAVRSFSDEQVAACPNCGKPPRKLFTAPAIVFKGSGWYKTDSRTSPKSESNGSKTDTKTDAKTDTKTDTKTDMKSDTKGEGKSDAKSAGKSDAKSEAKPASTKSEGSS